MGAGAGANYANCSCELRRTRPPRHSDRYRATPRQLSPNGTPRGAARPSADLEHSYSATRTGSGPALARAHGPPTIVAAVRGHVSPAWRAGGRDRVGWCHGVKPNAGGAARLVDLLDSSLTAHESTSAGTGRAEDFRSSAGWASMGVSLPPARRVGGAMGLPTWLGLSGPASRPYTSWRFSAREARPVRCTTADHVRGDAGQGRGRVSDQHRRDDRWIFPTRVRSRTCPSGARASEAARGPRTVPPCPVRARLRPR